MNPWLGFYAEASALFGDANCAACDATQAAAFGGLSGWIEATVAHFSLAAGPEALFGVLPAAADNATNGCGPCTPSVGGDAGAFPALAVRLGFTAPLSRALALRAGADFHGVWSTRAPPSVGLFPGSSNEYFVLFGLGIQSR